MGVDNGNLQAPEFAEKLLQKPLHSFYGKDESIPSQHAGNPNVTICKKAGGRRKKVLARAFGDCSISTLDHGEHSVEDSIIASASLSDTFVPLRATTGIFSAT